MSSSTFTTQSHRIYMSMSSTILSICIHYTISRFLIIAVPYLIWSWRPQNHLTMWHINTRLYFFGGQRGLLTSTRIGQSAHEIQNTVGRVAGVTSGVPCFVIVLLLIREQYWDASHPHPNCMTTGGAPLTSDQTKNAFILCDGQMCMSFWA